MAGEPTINPYAPPVSDGMSPAPDLSGGAFPRALFSPRQMLAAAIFGSMVAGVLLLQANYRAMGRRAAANKTLVFGMLASAALMALFFVLPARVPGTPISIATALTFYKLADVMQGPAFFKHRAAGGDRRSNWLVFAISVGALIALLGVILAILQVSGGLDELAVAGAARR